MVTKSVIFQATITCTLWVLLNEILFPKNHSYRAAKNLLAIAALTFTQVLMIPAAPTPIYAGTLILLYYCCKFVFLKGADINLIPEAMVGYILSNALAMLYSTLIMMACAMLGAKPSYFAVTVIELAALSVTLLLFYKIYSRKKASLFTLGRSRVVVLGYFILFLIPFGVLRTKYDSAQTDLYLLALTIIIACMVLLTVFAAHEYKAAAQAGKKDAVIQDMVGEVHHAREVLPAIMSELKEIKSVLTRYDSAVSAELSLTLKDVEAVLNELEMDTQTTYPGAILPETGLRLLDRQLRLESERAVTKSISFEVIVVSKADFLVRSGVITLKKLQQLVGDLVSNAIRIVSKQLDGTKAILIMLGQAGPWYQFQIFDSGAYFVPRTLNQIGLRGVTTDGTGQGFADIVAVLLKCGGSLSIEEFAPGEDKYTKCITVAFDGENTLRVQSWNPAVKNRVCDLGDLARDDSHQFL